MADGRTFRGGFGAVLLAGGLLATPAAAWEAGTGELLCRRDEVARVVGREMRARNAYAEFDRSSVTEWPTADANVVRCTALSLVRDRPDPLTGLPGVGRRELYFYSVQVSGNRFAVRFGN